MCHRADYFREVIQPSHTWEYMSPAHSIVVPGDVAVYKTPAFEWSENAPEKMQLRQGKYQLRVDLWSKLSDLPTITSTHSLFLSESQANQIEQNRENRELMYLPLDTDTAISRNRTLSGHELRRLLGE